MPEPLACPSPVYSPPIPPPSSSMHQVKDEQEPAYVAEHSVLRAHTSPATSKTPADQPLNGGHDGVAKLRDAVLKASEADVLPKQPLRRALIDAFFTHVGHSVPVVTRLEVCSPGASVLLQQVVCLVGSLTRQSNSQQTQFQAHQYQKVKLLLAMNAESNMLNVLKAKCLLTLWSPVASSVVSLDSPWHVNSSAIRLAVQMGLHRRSTYVGRSDTSCRRRIWWLLYVGSRNNCLAHKTSDHRNLG